MTARASCTAAVPPWGLAVAAMLSVQLGSALSMHLVSTVGPAGTAWLRLSMGGTLMALEPAIGVLLGLLVLHQTPSATQIAGILIVVLAGTAAQRDGRRSPPATERTGAHSELDLIG
jgi:threonine/homoserine efflux transporter RhtA